MTSNGVEVERLSPPSCEHCSNEPAAVVVRVTGTPVTRHVCLSCLIANDGRIGWPLYSEIARSFAGSEPPAYRY